MALLLNLVQWLLMAVWALVLGRMVASWVDPGGGSQVSAFLIRTTDPILAPVRRVLRGTGAIDWSGFVVLIVVGFLWRAI